MCRYIVFLTIVGVAAFGLAWAGLDACVNARIRDGEGKSSILICSVCQYKSTHQDNLMLICQIFCFFL
jgi:hypothetical protein